VAWRVSLATRRDQSPAVSLAGIAIFEVSELKASEELLMYTNIYTVGFMSGNPDLPFPKKKNIEWGCFRTKR
jgi:hypothetical protein